MTTFSFVHQEGNTLSFENKTIEENPRQTEEYKDKCLKEPGLGKYFDAARYPHIVEQPDKDLLEWRIASSSGSSFPVYLHGLGFG